MSFSEKTMTKPSSSLISRRLFARRGVAALAALASGSVAKSVGAQDSQIVEDDPQWQPDVEQTESTQPVRSGQFIADFALQFAGYPYVWAGNTPAGFDCSGFTQYVILNTVGYDIGHSTGGQMNTGTWVAAADLQPGDLVYFAGTFGPGVSHAGVYIGDNQFIHSENYGTGVTISWLWSDYYAAHYYGATRHW